MAGAPTAIAEEPYVGLAHFTEEYADRFFGRDRECGLIIGNLRAARLTLLYAESGVGKSSVLRAGVVARLHEAAERDVRTRGRPRLVPVVFSSWSEGGVRPLVRALAEAARPYREGDTAPDLPADDLEQALEMVSGELDATVLVILDQFEEYFLYADEADRRHRVAAQIARCVNRPDLRANFLISIREDSYARLGDLFRGKLMDVYGNFLHLEFLDRDGAREAIERPVERIDEVEAEAGTEAEPHTLEPALVDAVLDQVGRGGAGAEEDGGRGRDEIETTYLQLVMRRLWEEEASAGSRHLGLATLEELGGAQAIIRGHLDRAMEGEGEEGAGLSADQRRIAAAAFHFLVTSGGTKIALTARDLSDLSGIDAAEIEPVLHHLSSPRLHILRPVAAEDGRDEPRYEIFHDALAQPIVEWRTKVEEAELDARLARERAEKEAAQRAAAEAERREATERRRKRVALGLLGLAVVALVVGAILVALHQSDVAEQRKRETDSVRAAQLTRELARSPTFGPVAAALAGLEAYRLSPTPAARDVAQAQLQLNPGLPMIAVGHTRGVNAVSYWPDSPGLATGGADGTVRFWEEERDPGRVRNLGRPLVIPGGGGVESVAVSRLLSDGTRLVAAGLSKGGVDVWKIDPSTYFTAKSRPKPERIPARRGHQALAFDPRSATTLAVGDSTGAVALWDLGDLTEPSAKREATKSAVSDLAFSADGRRLLVAGGKGLAFRMRGPHFAAGEPATLYDRPATAVATSRTGAFAFGGGNEVRAWKRIGEPGARIPVAGDVRSLAFAHDGSVLVSAGTDWNVTTWNVASGRPFGPPRAARGTINDVAVGNRGRTIVGVSEDRMVRLWPLAPRRPLAWTVGGLSLGETHGRLGAIHDLAAGGRGRVAAAAGPAPASIWSLGDPGDAASVPVPRATVPVESPAVAYWGDWLAVARGKSFELEGTGGDCPTMPAGPCGRRGPTEPHSTAAVRSLAIQRYAGRLILASSGTERARACKKHSGLSGKVGVVNLWDVTEGKIRYLSCREFPSRTRVVALSPASPIVAVGTTDGKTRAWDIRDPGRPAGVRIKGAHGNEYQPVDAVAFSPAGGLMASAGADQQIVLWRLSRAAGELSVTRIPGRFFQTQTILSLAFSRPRGEVLAAGDAKGVTCLYEVAARRPIGDACLQGHAPGDARAGGIEAVTFARGSDRRQYLLTAGAGQPIVAWDPVLWHPAEGGATDAELARGVCRIAGRNFTGERGQEQWTAVFGLTSLAGRPRRIC